MTTTNQLVLDGLRAIREEHVPGWRRQNSSGICHNLDRYFDKIEAWDDHDMPRLGDLFEAWGMHSAYPVEATLAEAEALGYDEYLEQDGVDINEYVFDHTDNMYIGSYGRRRLALLDRLIAHFEEQV